MWMQYDIHPPAGEHELLRVSVDMKTTAHALCEKLIWRHTGLSIFRVHVSVEKLRNYFVSWWFLLTRELYKSFFCCTEISSTTQVAVLKADWGRQDRGAFTFTAVLCSVCPPALSRLTKNKHSSVPKARTSSRQEWTWPGSLESWECWEQASVCYLDRLISK